MRWIRGLLAALLLAALLCCPAAAQSSFTGKVTLYSRSKREAYVQNGTTGKLVRLDKSNGDRLDEIKAGKVLTVSGFEVTHEQGGYLLPEISDAMIESISDGGASATTVNATLDQLGNGLMAVRVRVKGTKAQLSSANLQLSLDGYEDGQTLTVTGVLSANTHGRIILGASIQADARAYARRGTGARFHGDPGGGRTGSDGSPPQPHRGGNGPRTHSRAIVGA